MAFHSHLEILSVSPEKSQTPNGLIKEREDFKLCLERVRNCNPQIEALRCTPYPKQSYGPVFWTMLHKMAILGRFTILTSEMDKLLQLMDSIMEQFPCKLCLKSYSEYVHTRRSASHYVASTKGATILSNMALFRWTWAVHNLANAKLDKGHMSFDDAREQYIE